MVDTALRRLVPDRPLIVVMFVALALFTTALFVPTFDAYVAVDGIEEADTRVTDASVGPDQETLELDLRFENPTSSSVTVVSGQVTARDDGTLVTRIAGTDVDSTTVPGGETTTLPVTVDVAPSERERAVAAARDGRLRFKGFLWVTVGDERVKVRMRPQGVANDGD